MKIGRHSGTGRFIPVERARRLGDRAQVETIRHPAAPPPKPNGRGK